MEHTIELLNIVGQGIEVGGIILAVFGFLGLSEERDVALAMLRLAAVACLVGIFVLLTAAIMADLSTPSHSPAPAPQVETTPSSK